MVFGADTGSAVAAPMVVKLWAQLLVVADMRTGQQVTTSAMISVPLRHRWCRRRRFFGVVGDHAGDFGASRPWRRSKKGAIFWCFHKKRKEKRRRKRKEKKEKRREKNKRKGEKREKKKRKEKKKMGKN